MGDRRTTDLMLSDVRRYQEGGELPSLEEYPKTNPDKRTAWLELLARILSEDEYRRYSMGANYDEYGGSDQSKIRSGVNKYQPRGREENPR